MKTMGNMRRWLALLLAFVMVILTGCSGSKKQEEPVPAATTAATEAPAPTPEATEIPAATEAPAFVEDESLILYIKDSMLDVGGDGTLEVSVLCGDGVKDNIDVMDDAGTVLHTIENTSGGKRYEISVEVPTETERVGTLSARTGRAESTPRKFYVYPEVTEEMVARLDEAGANMLEYVASCDFEDTHCDDAYRQVADWLNQQDYIDYAEVNGDGVLFRTTDGLMGGYGYHPTEGYLGSAGEDSEPVAEADYGIFADPERVFEDWLNGKKSSADLLESQIPITNNNYLVWAGDYNDKTIGDISSKSSSILSVLRNETDGCNLISANEDTLGILNRGEITDYGFLMLCGHGVTNLIREDGSAQFAFTVAEDTPENREALSQEKYKELFSLRGNDDAMAFLWSNDEGEGGIAVTDNYIASKLGDKIFDNTIVFLSICQGMRDSQFYEMLLEHGASAVLGSVNKMDGEHIVSVIYEIVNTLVSVNASGGYGTLSEALNRIETEAIFSTEGDFNGCKPMIDDSSLSEFIYYSTDYFVAFRDEIVSDWTAAPVIMRTREMSPAQQAKATVENPYANRQFLGYGLSTGLVVDNAGEPIVDAEVRLYRWLNHDFILHEAEAEGPVQDGESPDILPVIVKTNELGEFSIKNVPYGLYVAYAEKDGRYGFTPFFVQAPGNEAVVTIKDNPFIMTTGVQEYVNPKLSAQIARPSFSLKGNEFVDDLGGMMRPLFSDAVLAVDDMMATPIYDGRKHISVAGVRDVFVSDRHVSVRVGSYQEYSNSAHGMHYWDSYTYWLDTGLPVQLHEILDPGVEQASYRLRTLWRNAIYHNGITDEMLWQPLERTLEAALLGDFPCYWSFTSEGLNLQFPLYEAGPYAVGSMEVTLPYHRLVYVIAPEFLPNDPPDELTVENEPVSASVMPIVFGKDYKHRFQEANEAAIRDGLEPPHPVYGTETDGGHLIAVDGYAEDFRILFDPEAYSEPIMLFFASSIENALVWLPDLEDDTFEAVWEADGVTRSVSLKF